MARKILLNYRRADTKGYAVAIHTSLVSRFGKDQIFIDIDAIEPGTDFVKVLEKAVRQCDVLLVLIGPQWLEIKDASGERRLDNASDFVRIEIKAALEREISVLPVLVQGAIMPTAAKLPADIRSLARRQAFVISDRFSTDVEQLAEVLSRTLERARRERQEKERAEKKKKKTTKPLIRRIPFFVRKRPEKVPRSTSVKADLKPVASGKAEKKKPAEPFIETPAPDPLVQKRPVKVPESTPVKAEVKPIAAEKARQRVPVKPIPKVAKQISYALTAAAILVISYVLIKNTDIFTKDLKPAEDAAISSSISTKEQIPTKIPAVTETPTYPISGGLSSIADEIITINTSNVDQIIELVRWDDGVIHKLAYSPVENVIAVATSNDIHILQVDQTDGNYELNEIRTIHFDAALSFDTTRTNLSVSPDGNILASGHEDGSVRLWQVSDGELLHTLWVPPLLSAGAIAFSPDGSTLAFHAGGRAVQLWRVSDGKFVRNLGNQNLPFTECTAFSPDGTMLASGHNDGAVRLWQVSDGELLDMFGESKNTASDRVGAVAFSPDGSTLASGYPDGTVQLWQISDGNLLEILPEDFDWDRGWINSVTFSPDGSMLAAGYAHETARIWRTSDWKVLTDLEYSHNGYALSVSFSPDGILFATSSTGGAVRLVRVSDWEEVASSSWDSAGIDSIALSPDKSLIASACGDGRVRVWRVSDGSLLYRLESDSKEVTSVAFSPDGNMLASGHDDAVRLWRVSDGELLNRIKSTSGWVITVAFSPDGRTLASGTEGDDVQLWRVTDGTLLNSLRGHTSEVRSVAFSPDGSMLAAGDDDDGDVLLWRVSDGKLLHTLEGHSDSVLSVAFSPDGSMLASGDLLGQVRLWRVSDGGLIHEVEPDHEYENWVNSLSFTPDGEVLSGCGKYIWLWGVSEGNLLKRLGWCESSISCMALSSDGNLLVTGSFDSTIQIWGVVD